MKRTVTRSTRSTRKSSKKRVRSAASQMRPASTLRDEISMGSAPGIVSKLGPVHERNGMTTQTISSYAPKRRYKIHMSELNNIICPPYKYRYDGFGYNTALVRWNGLLPDAVPTYNNSTGVSDYSRDALAKPQGNWRSCEWASGNQYWFESPALPMYKKIADGSRVSVTELIRKYGDVSSLGNAHIFGNNLDINTYYEAIESQITSSESANGDPTTVLNKLNFAFNICYHGGTQTHKFTNFGITDVHMELWELHPRHYMSGYKPIGSAYINGFTYDNVYEDVLKDHFENTPERNLRAPFDDKRAIDEIHDIGVRIDNDCRRVMFKYKVSAPKKIKIAPGGTFTYVMNIPAFKVSGGEFLEYLNRHVHLEGGLSTDRIIARPSYIPKFTRILCGRMYGQKGFNLGADGLKADGNTGDTSYIKGVGFGAGRVGHTMSEYHAMNLMPYMKPSNYSRVSYLDTLNITNFVDGADNEVIVFGDQDGNDTQQTSNNLMSINSGN